MSKVMLQTEGSDQSSRILLGLLADPFNTEIQSDAIVVSLATSLGFTILITLIFCFLRPYNTNVYAPRLKHFNAERTPPPLKRGFFAWVKPIIKAHEKDYLEVVGPDAAIFIRFASMCRNIFLALTIFGCAIILPTNILAGKNLYSKFDGVPTLAKITPQYVIGEAAWAYVICAYIFDGIVAYYLLANYKAVVNLRRKFFESSDYQGSLHARTVMITDIPEIDRNTDNIIRIIRTLSGSISIVEASMARDVGELPNLIEEYDGIVRKLESCLAQYLRDLRKSSAPRLILPDHPDGSLEKLKGVEALTRYYSKLEDLSMRIREARGSIDERNALSFGFVTFDRVIDAHDIARTASKKQLKGSKVQLAPRNDDLLWNNLLLSKSAQRRKTVLSNFWGLFLTIIWTIPNVFIAVFLSNLTNLGNVWPDFQKQLYANPNFWAIFQGIAAPAILSLVYFYLPSIFRRLSMRAGDLSRTARDRHVLRKLYNFFLFNNLVVFSLFSAVWAFAAAVIAAGKSESSASDALNEGRLLEKVLQALCNGSFFWVMWLLQRNLGAAIDLSQIWSLAWSSFAHKLMNPTPRQINESTVPPFFDYASYYNYFLFYATVALCYSVLQPLVLPVAALYFFIDTWLKKYLLLYVFSTKNESGGQIWRMLFNRLWFALFLSNIVVLVVVAAQGYNITMVIAMAPLFLLFSGFKLYCVRHFDDKIQYYNQYNATETGNAKGISIDRNLNANSTPRYRHPAISKPLSRPIIFNTWAEQVKKLMYNMQVIFEEKGHGGFITDPNIDNIQPSLNTRENFRLEFDVFKAKHDQIRRDTSVTGSQSEYNTNSDEVASSIPLSELHRTSRSLGESATGPTSLNEDSLETTYPTGYHKAPTANKSYSPCKDTFADTFQQRRQNGTNQHELLLPNATPMGQAYSDIETPGSARDNETGYF